MKLTFFTITLSLLLLLANAVHKTNLQQMIQTNADKKKKKQPKITDNTTFASNSSTTPV